MLYDDPARIDTSLDCRSICFENPTGDRGAGGTALNGRKGAPARNVEAGEKLVLADIAGPGRVRHIWVTVMPLPPEKMRALWVEVYYDGMDEPSISVPLLDFFALPHGRPVELTSAMVAVQQGRGFNAYFPMPFAKNMRFEFTNGADVPIILFYQIDYTLEKVASDAGYLHISFRRENPTTLLQDFVIAEGLKGPGRFLGCAVGVRVHDDDMMWYGEGEIKIYRDGDKDLPTICGTGLEDYVGTAWGMEQHCAPYAGVPIFVVDPDPAVPQILPQPDFVSFYRWHLADPIVFNEDLTVTIQQIGALGLAKGEEDKLEEMKEKYQPAGEGWMMAKDMPGMEDSPMLANTIAERVDDYSAAAFVYCQEPQAVPRLDVAAATVDLERLPYEGPTPIEMMMGASTD